MKNEVWTTGYFMFESGEVSNIYTVRGGIKSLKVDVSYGEIRRHFEKLGFNTNELQIGKWKTINQNLFQITCKIGDIFSTKVTLIIKEVKTY